MIEEAASSRHRTESYWGVHHSHILPMIVNNIRWKTKACQMQMKTTHFWVFAVIFGPLFPERKQKSDGPIAKLHILGENKTLQDLVQKKKKKTAKHPWFIGSNWSFAEKWISCLRYLHDNAAHAQPNTVDAGYTSSCLPHAPCFATKKVLQHTSLNAYALYTKTEISD